MDDKEINKLIVFDNFQLEKLSDDDCGFLLWYDKYVIQPAIEKVKTRLKTGTVLSLETNRYKISISKPRPSSTKIVNEIDWDNIVEFGKQHNFNIPMTPDIEEMKNLGWVKECLEQTTFWKQVQKPTRAYNGAIEIIEKEGK